MPPRHAYWTIIVDDQATAFRAHDEEELLPTLNRMKEKNPSAVMKWFERGQLFESRDAARQEGLGQGERRWEGPRPERDERASRAPRDDTKRPERQDARRPPRRDGDGAPRGRDWRPGGEHRDPRQKFRDAKKAKWDRFKSRVRERHEERSGPPPERTSRPRFEPRDDSRPPVPSERPRSRPWDEERSRSGARPKPEGGAWRPKPAGGAWKSSAEPRERSWGTKPSGPRSDRPRAPWGKKPAGAWGDKPSGSWGDRPRKPWGSKPPSARVDRPSGPWRSKSDAPRGTRPSGPPSKPWGAQRKAPWGTKPGGAGAGRRPWGPPKAGGGPPRRPGGGFRPKPSFGPPTKRRRRDEEE